MGWADAPPDPDLVSGSDWTSQPPDKDLYSLGGFGENVAKGVVSNLNPINIAKGVGSQLKAGLYDFPKQAISDSTNALRNVAGAITGREDLEMPHIPLQEMVTEHPMVKDPVNFLYEKPVDAAMLASTPFLPFMERKGAGLASAENARIPTIDDILPPLSKLPPKPSPAGAEIPLEPMPPGAAGKSATAEASEDFSNNPPPKPPPESAGVPPPDPRKALYDKLIGKLGPLYKEQIANDPSQIQKAGGWLQNEAQKLAGHDIHLKDRQIASMGPGFIGVDRAKDLLNYARDQGYFDLGLTDMARERQVRANIAKIGPRLESVRELGNERGVPPIPEMRQQLIDELTPEHGVDDAPEIAKVLEHFDNAVKRNPTFTGMADLATKLYKRQTPPGRLGPNPGPTTQAAGIISRMNNEALRPLLNPEENNIYTTDLRDFGAHKKLEQAIAGGERRGLTARTNQRDFFGKLWQEALDRGLYRAGGKLAHKLGKGMIENPERYKTLPQFFEEFAHETADILDEAKEPPQFAHGGIVGELGGYLESKYGKNEMPQVRY